MSEGVPRDTPALKALKYSLRSFPAVSDIPFRDPLGHRSLTVPYLFEKGYIILLPLPIELHLIVVTSNFS